MARGGESHVVRGKAKDPKTGRTVEVWKVHPLLGAAESLVWLNHETDRIRHGERSASRPKQHFATFAVSLLKQKVAAGDIKSQAAFRSGRAP